MLNSIYLCAVKFHRSENSMSMNSCLRACIIFEHCPKSHDLLMLLRSRLNPLLLPSIFGWSVYYWGEKFPWLLIFIHRTFVSAVYCIGSSAGGFLPSRGGTQWIYISTDKVQSTIYILHFIPFYWTMNEESATIQSASFHFLSLSSSWQLYVLYTISNSHPPSCSLSLVLLILYSCIISSQASLTSLSFVFSVSLSFGH